MNKTAIKNFAVWARNKLIADISYRASLMGITESGIASALPQSTGTTEFYDIGTAEPYAISGDAVRQRRRLVELIERKAKETDYKTAYKYIIEEVAYTWFNRLIAIRFMEVNDYLPSHIRVLSSESGKLEPDLVTNPFDADFEFTSEEEQIIIRLKQGNELDELFRLLFIKQCNKLFDYLPGLFGKTNDYSELLLNISVIDKEGIVYHLVNDIKEEDFDVNQGGQVEIIGWLYQFYNTELNEQVYDGKMSKSRIEKELLPAATTIYTPDWAIRYMAQNSLGKLWKMGHINDEFGKWKYYLPDAPQSAFIREQLKRIVDDFQDIAPENIRLIDPCMGSGHILVYCFDMLMDIYESQGYSSRDAASMILENNLYGFDIDNRAAQLSYFAVMMKARECDRRILTRNVNTHVFAIVESNNINRMHLNYFGATMSAQDKQEANRSIVEILDVFKDSKEYGSILKVSDYNWELLEKFIDDVNVDSQISFDTIGIEETKECLYQLLVQARAFAQKYHVVITNPPYLGNSRFSPKLDKYVKNYYPDEKTDLSMVMYRKALEDFCLENGFVAFITTSSWMFLSSFEKVRKYMHQISAITSLVDFGTELFEGKVGHNPIVAWVSCKAKINYKLTAVRLVDYCYARRDEKEPEFFNEKNRFYSEIDDFSNVPGSPIAYWASDNLLNAFKNQTIGEIAKPRQGLATGENNRFTRLWFELNPDNISFNSDSREYAMKSGKSWFPYNKGGEFRKWYGNNDYVVNWENDGYEIRNFKDDKGKLRSRPQNMDNYFKPSITWSKISSGSIAFRYKPAGHIFDVAGTSIFASDDMRQYIHGFCNSKIALKIARLLSPTLNYEVGHVASFPVIVDPAYKAEVESIVENNIKISKMDWDSFELSWDFIKHPLVNKGVKTVEAAFKIWEEECNNRFETLKKNEESLNRIFIKIYGLEDEMDDKVLDKDVTVRKANLQREIKSLLSYAVGCMFGRYSLDKSGIAYAGGVWNSKIYKTYIPDQDAIIPITDEEYLEDDIIARLCQWLKVVYGKEQLEENLDYIAKGLGINGETSREIIRKYFINDFFADHCARCTVGVGGKRPIYWMFESGKQIAFKALVYTHRYSADTIGQIRVDYLHRMQRVYESEINRMQDTIDNSSNTREVTTATKRKEKLQKQIKECREYDEKIGHLALSRIDIDLDDGVKVNYEKVQTASDGKKYQVLAKI